MCCDMNTSIFKGNAKDRPNYNMTCTINAAAIIEINHQPRSPHRPPNRQTDLMLLVADIVHDE